MLMIYGMIFFSSQILRKIICFEIFSGENKQKILVHQSNESVSTVFERYDISLNLR